MPQLNYKELTVRHRPHFQPLDATLFVTFRLAGSIPNSLVRFYRAKLQWYREHLRRVERIASEDAAGEHAQWLADTEQLYREWFVKSENIMHRELMGPTWLRQPDIAAKVADNLHRLDGKEYRLDAYSIMSNHVHTVFKPLVSEEVLAEILRGLRTADSVPALSRIMKLIKGRSARECNLLLGRSGSFWEHESFDHAIRERKFEKTVRYVLNNPVKIRVVDRWQDYRWNYLRKDLWDRFE